MAELDDHDIERLRRLLDRQDIADCIHRYARGLDRRDEDLVRSAYHPDAIEDHGQYVGGLDGLVKYLMDVHEPFAGYQRHVTTQNIAVDGDEAHAESYFLSVIRVDGSTKLRLTGGRYVDRLERRDRERRIASRVVSLEWYGACSRRRRHRSSDAGRAATRRRRRVLRAAAVDHPRRSHALTDDAGVQELATHSGEQGRQHDVFELVLPFDHRPVTAVGEDVHLALRDDADRHQHAVERVTRSSCPEAIRVGASILATPTTSSATIGS